MTEPLEALLRLRRLTADEARRGLADCLRNEDYAMHAVATIEATIEHEMEVATSLLGGDAEVEAFAAWLQRIRPKQRAALVAEEQAEAETANARAVLSAARAAVKAAEEMLAKHEAARLARAEHHEQQEIDEAAQRIPRPTECDPSVMAGAGRPSTSLPVAGSKDPDGGPPPAMTA